MPKTGLGELILYGGLIYISWKILTEWNIISQSPPYNQSLSSTCNSCKGKSLNLNITNLNGWKPLTNEQLTNIYNINK